MSTRLEGDGTVRLDSPGGPLLLSARGSSWTLDLSGPSAARSLWKAGSALSPGRRRGLRRFAGSLSRVGLRIEVRSAGRMLAVVGRGSQGSWLSRLLGGPHAELRLGSLFAFLLRRNARSTHR